MSYSTTVRVAMALGCGATIGAAFWLGKTGAPPASPDFDTAQISSPPASASVAARTEQLASLPELAKLCDSHPELARRFYLSWAKHAPRAALDAAMALSGPSRTSAIEGVLAGWARTDAAAAWRWLARKELNNELPPGVSASAAAQAIASGQNWYADDDHLHRTFRWEKLETRMLTSTPPWESKTAKFDAATFTPDSARFQRLALFVQGGAQFDGLMVADWIAGQEFDSEAKGQLLDVAAKNWLRQPVSADQILAWAQESSGPEMDRAKSTIAATVGPDSQLTLGILRSISDADIRIAAVFRAAASNPSPMNAARLDWLGEAAQTVPASAGNDALTYAFAQWYAKDAPAARSYFQDLQKKAPARASVLSAALARLGG